MGLLLGAALDAIIDIIATEATTNSVYSFERFTEIFVKLQTEVACYIKNITFLEPNDFQNNYAIKANIIGNIFVIQKLCGMITHVIKNHSASNNASLRLHLEQLQKAIESIYYIVEDHLHYFELTKDAVTASYEPIFKTLPALEAFAYNKIEHKAPMKFHL